MSKVTKKVFVLSVAILIATICVLSFFIYKIHVQGVRLEEQVEILAENNKKESSYIRLKRLVQETESERNELASSFFKEEGDSIVFLGDIETLATSLGLMLKIDSLTKITDTDKKQDFININLIFSGQKDAVFNFSKLMEVAPYHSQVESLVLSKVTENEWKGELSILVTINPI